MRPADDSRQQWRNVFRIAGPLMVIAGVGLIVFGAVRMFGPVLEDSAGDVGFDSPPSFEAFSEHHRTSQKQFRENARSSFGGFGIAAAGMALAGAGGWLCVAGYGGAVARYAADELSPAIESGARALDRGLGRGGRSHGRGENPTAVGYCSQCGAAHEGDDRFCSQCGRKLND